MGRMKIILPLQIIITSLQIRIRKKFMNRRMKKKGLDLLLCLKTKQGKDLKIGFIVLPILAQGLTSKISQIKAKTRRIK